MCVAPLCVWLQLLVISYHHLAGLVDITTAQGDDQIARLGVLLDPVGGSL